DYTRTAVLKGLSKQTVLRKHVLRNALLPTIAVVATQVGYLIGGLIVIEKIFKYPGIGLRIYTAAQNKDFTMLEAGVIIVGWWVFWAIVGSSLTPHDPLDQTPAVLARPFGHYWLGTDSLGRDVLSRVLAGATGVLKVAPLATILGIAGGTAIGLVTGYFRGIVDDSVSRLIDAVLALPLIVIAVTAIVALGTSLATLIVVIGVVFMPIVSRTVRAAVLAERDLDYVQ